MRRLLILILLLPILLSGCLLEDAAVPIPRPAPIHWPSLDSVLPRDLPLPQAWRWPAPITVPLPDIRVIPMPRTHAEERHGPSVERARRAPEDSPCRFYICAVSRSQNNLLRLCYLGDMEYAVQWMFYAPDLGKWVEGTSFTKHMKDVRGFLIKRGCIPAE